MRPFASNVGNSAIPMADIFTELADQLKELQELKATIPNPNIEAAT
jgi:hypothetical protein